jgi:hypothetical protein
MTWAAVGISGATVAGSLISTYGKKKTVNPQDMYTPQQLAAQQQLSDFSSTGKFGDFQAGAAVPLGYGDYGMTGIEGQGQTALQGLLKSGIPDQFKMGDMALQDMLQTNPAAIEKQFDPFKGQVQRQIGESNRALKRSAAFGGNLYSTDTVRNLGDIQARGNETLTSKLADLTNQQADRRLQAIPLAYQSGQAQENITQGRISASPQYGGLARQLHDASIKMRDAELLRRRQELQLPIDAAKTLAGQPGSSFPSVQSSPYQALLGTVGQIGGQYLGNQIFANQYKTFANPSADPHAPPDSANTGQYRPFAEGGIVHDPDVVSDPETMRKVMELILRKYGPPSVSVPGPEQGVDIYRGEDGRHHAAHSNMASEGWLVPGQAEHAGNSPRNDTVRARLSPGEAVISRIGVQKHPELIQYLLHMGHGR